MPLALLSPLAKYLVMGAAVVAILLSAFLYGRKTKQIEWDAAIAQQAVAAAASVIEQAESTAKVETQFVHEQARVKIVTQQVDREVIKYVSRPNSTCVLSPEFERAFNRVSELLDVPRADGLSASTGAADLTVEPSGPVPTTVALVRVHRDATVQLRELWTAYHALVEWVRTSYDLQRAGAGLPPLVTE